MHDKHAIAMKIHSRHEGTTDTKVGKLMAENFVIFVSFVVKSVVLYHTENHFRRRLAIEAFVIACCLTTGSSAQDKKSGRRHHRLLRDQRQLRAAVGGPGSWPV